MVENRLIVPFVAVEGQALQQQKWILIFALQLLDIICNTTRKVLTNLSLTKEVRGWSS